MYDYITIERRYGSGGHEIATLLAERLGYRMYDRKVVVETCKRMDLPYGMVSGMDERNAVKQIFKAKGNKHPALEDQIYETEVAVIREAAEKPGCIFVGRCAGEIIKDKKPLRVFITASEEFRLGRAVEKENQEPDEARNVMNQFDKKREKFFSSHAGARWGSSEFFDVIINTSTLGIEASVTMLEALVRC